MTIYFLILNLSAFILLIYLKDIICKKLNLIILSKKNTFHKKKSFLIGGLILFVSFIFNHFFLIINEFDFLYLNFLFVVSLFVIAFVDDIYDISPYQKILYCSLFLFLTLYLDNTLSIRTIKSYYFDLFYFPNSKFVKYFFPILCVLLLVNAFNFIDGINGLAGTVGLSIVLYLVVKNIDLINHIFLIIIFLILFLYFNFKKSFFLGDSGNYLISAIISSIILKENYLDPHMYYVEEIFLLLLIPGLDMLRLFIQRISNKKNPLYGDNNHLHHILFYKFGLVKTLMTYLLLINIPLYIYFFTQKYIAIIICPTTIF